MQFLIRILIKTLMNATLVRSIVIQMQHALIQLVRIRVHATLVLRALGSRAMAKIMAMGLDVLVRTHIFFILRVNVNFFLIEY